MNKIHYIPMGCHTFQVFYDGGNWWLKAESRRFRTLEEMLKDFEQYEVIFFQGISDSLARHEPIIYDTNFIYPCYCGLTKEEMNCRNLTGRFIGFYKDGFYE